MSRELKKLQDFLGEFSPRRIQEAEEENGYEWTDMLIRSALKELKKYASKEEKIVDEKEWDETKKE
jgi:hypothetical protein